MATFTFTDTDFKGKHAIKVVKKVINEVQEPNFAAAAFKESIVKEVEKLSNNIPDWDTGYKKVTVANTYIIEHNFGSVPVRSAMFISTVEEPEENDFVYELASHISKDTGGVGICGVLLRHEMNGNESKLVTGDNTLLLSDANWATAYVRVLLWR